MTRIERIRRLLGFIPRVNNKAEFLNMLYMGKPVRPFIVSEGLYVNMHSVRSLNGVILEDGVLVHGLVGLTDMNGVVLDGEVALRDMLAIVVVPIRPTDSEIEILGKIPIGEDIGKWELCGGMNFVAGWVQEFIGIPRDRTTTHRDALALLPSMAPYFYCSNEQVLTYLKTLHK